MSWRRVPEIPSPAMIAGGAFAIGTAFPSLDVRTCQQLARDVWQEMLEHRPTPPQRYPGLTRRQSQILELIREFVDAHGYSPTEYQISDLAGVKKSTAHVYLEHLLDAGYIRKTKRIRDTPNSRRTFALTKRTSEL